MKKQYAIPALILGLALLGGGTATYAAMTPGSLPADVLSQFSDDQQAAIEKARDIRQTAETEAQAVLSAAGVSEDQLHSALETHMKAQREAENAALDDNDYTAFQTAVAGSPMADKLTEDVFAKLVQIRQLEKSGDHEGAMKLRQELGDAGFGPRGHAPHGPPLST